MTQTEPTTRADTDPIGELADAERLLKPACKLVEHLIPDGDDAQEAILGVLSDKIDAATRCLRPTWTMKTFLDILIFIAVVTTLVVVLSAIGGT